jgi:small subunit ribosomal protein S17
MDEMADQPDNDTQDTPQDPTEQGPEAEASGGQPAAEAVEAAQVDATDAPDAQAPEAAGNTQGAPSEPVEQLSPKERRRKARSKRAGETRAPRSPEERHAERLAERRDKAVRRRTRRLSERAKAVERRAAAPAADQSEVGQLAPVHAAVEGMRRVRQGVVVSDKAEKTITVRIDIARRHRRYEKIVRSSSTVHAHDEKNEAHEGDVVRVIESRPLSRTKRWALVDVLERAR